METKISISSYASSNIGLVRTTNEDFFAQMHYERFFAVADGIGGHNAGEVAAKETVEFLCKEMELLHPILQTIEEHEKAVKHFDTLIDLVNQRILTLGEKHTQFQGMGTTLCFTYFFDRYLLYSHVGDSRLYRYRGGDLTQLTMDHSIRNIAKKTPHSPPSSSKNISKKSLIKAIGTHKNIDPDIGIEALCVNDVYFLCSDGLSDFVSHQEILSILKKNQSIDASTEELIERAIYRGGKDNVTVLMMKVHDISR